MSRDRSYSGILATGARARELHGLEADGDLEAHAETHGDPRYARFPALRPVAEAEAIASAARLLAAAKDLA